MERLFSSCTRLRDILASRCRGIHFEGLQELNLDVSTDEFLSAESGFTYTDLYAMVGNEYTVLWLTPHAAVVRASPDEGGVWREYWDRMDEPFHFCFTADGKRICVLARSSEDLLEIFDVVVRLLVASVVYAVFLQPRRSSRDTALINVASLAYLMEHCQSLEFLALEDLEIDENHCRVLGTYSRPDLEIEMVRCKLTSAATSALAEVLGRNHGPTKLNWCGIDYCVLAHGFHGNSRLKLFIPHLSGNFEVGSRQVLAIADALKENKGLVNLIFYDGLWMSDETWGAICDSLETHPTIKFLHLCETKMDVTTAPAVIKSRIQVLVNMLKVNMSIDTIGSNFQYSEHELFRGSVIPYLETNRLRLRVRAIQKTRPITFRAKLLGRALLSACTDPNNFWIL
jgi:hypothetical protein